MCNVRLEVILATRPFHQTTCKFSTLDFLDPLPQVGKRSFVNDTFSILWLTAPGRVAPDLHDRQWVAQGLHMGAVHMKFVKHSSNWQMNSHPSRIFYPSLIKSLALLFIFQTSTAWPLGISFYDFGYFSCFVKKLHFYTNMPISRWISRTGFLAFRSCLSIFSR